LYKGGSTHAMRAVHNGAPHHSSREDGMYALYSSEPLVLERVREALPADAQGIATLSWQELTAAAPEADCVLIATRWLAADACAQVRLVASGDRQVPVVLVTTKDADNARAALQSGATHLVWLDDVRRDLHSLLRRLRAKPILLRAADLLEASPRLSQALRVALGAACRTERPLTSVGALAALLRRDRRTLWRHWRHGLGGAATPRLEDFLDWILLLNAAHRKVPNRSWARVARALGTHEHTLARMATRLTGLTLSQLAASEHQNLEERFLNAAVRPLLLGSDKVG
jgi:hypothetical protein